MTTVVIDEDLPRSTARLFSSLGFQVLEVRDCGLRGEPDERVFEYAQQHQAILVTGDLGFANVLRYPPGGYCGIIVIHFPTNVSPAVMNELIAKAMGQIREEELKGRLLIMEPGRTRIRQG